MNVLNELQRNANTITAIATVGLLMVALAAKSTWKEEIKTKRKKELADKLFNIVNFLRFHYNLITDESEKTLIWSWAIEYWGIELQNDTLRLRKAKLELNEINNDYLSFSNKRLFEKKYSETAKLINKNIEFIDRELNANSNNIIYPSIEECQLDMLKEFCMQEKRKFYS